MGHENCDLSHLDFLTAGNAREALPNKEAKHKCHRKYVSTRKTSKYYINKQFDLIAQMQI